MESVSRKIGNSIGVIFPAELRPQVGVKYDVWVIDDKIIFSPQKTDIFANPEEWRGFKEGLTQEEIDWDGMESVGKEL